MGWTDDVGDFFKWTADPGAIFKDENAVDPAKARLEDRNYLRNLYQSGVDDTLYRQGQAPQAGRTQIEGMDPRQQAQWRDQQMAQANRLAQISSGQQKGAGELAAQRQASRAIANQQAMARMGRGQPGMQRASARNAADIGVGAAGQAQQAALQDQQVANAQLGQLAGQGRQQDQAMVQMDQQRAFQQGALDQQRQLANIDMQLRAQGMNDQTRIAYLNQIAQMNQVELDARMRQEATAAGVPSQSSQMMQAAGPIIGAIAMSDERAKEEIRDGGADVDEMLDLLKPTTYRYKKGAPAEHTGNMGDGRRLAGIVAQHLEKSKAGKAIVVETGKGKGVDIVGGISASLAGLARLNARLRDLESRKG